MVDQATLIACLENFMFLASRGARGLRSFSYAGVRGHASDIARPLTNLVGAAGPGVAIPEASIDAVFHEFGQRNLPFLWLLGPHSPADLAFRLRQRGMTDFQSLSGLCASELDVRPCPSLARIREAQPSERDRFGNVLSDSFELDHEVVAFLGRHYFFASGLRTRNYFAFVEGQVEPVAVASSVYDLEAPVVVLAIAAVSQRFRGRGVYRQLVQRRLCDAKADGCVAAVVHALPASSAPICRRLGFREICTQELMGVC